MTADSEIARTLDLKGLKCPYPVLRTQKAMAEIPVGARVRVLATDPMSAIDLPHFCREKGHVLEEKSAEGDVLTFIIRRGQ